MSETKTKNLCTVPAADLNDSQYFIAEDGGELKRIPKAQVVLKKLEKMLATDTENLAGGGEVTAQELLDALAEQVANKLLAKSQVVNNLLATVEGNPLDATQGKALKDLIDTTNNNLSKKADATSLSSYALKSDLTAYSTKAQLESTFINLTNKRYVKITAAENYSNYGIIFAVTSHGILCVYSENGNFTTLFESAGNSVKISASGLVTTIDCVSTYTHGFILRGGSLKDMPYEISQS